MGILIGHNWTFARWIFGIEADISVLEAKSSQNAQPHLVDFLWSSNVRGRIGYGFGRFAPYITGGIAFGEAHTHAVVPALAGDTATFHGWSFGGGLDYAVTRRFLLRAEYFYQDFGKADYAIPGTGILSQSIDSHTFRLAAIVKSNGGDRPFEPLGPQGPTWGGWHFGVMAGAAGGDPNLSGGFAGAFIGYDYLFSNGLILGVEGDLSLSSLDGETRNAAGQIVTGDQFWTGSARVRFGREYGRFLPYVTGGWTISQVTLRGTGGPFPPVAVDPLKFGWTAGAGVEAAVSSGARLRLEYRYSDYDSVSGILGAPVTYNPNAHQIAGAVVVSLGH